MDIKDIVTQVNIRINILDIATIDVFTIILTILCLLIFIRLLINITRYLKQKKYEGLCDASFVSSSMYGKGKKAKKALVRYVINDKPIIKRMKIPKIYRKGENLVVKYNKNKITEAILQKDKTTLYKSIRAAIYFFVFLGIGIFYLIYVI